MQGRTIALIAGAIIIVIIIIVIVVVAMGSEDADAAADAPATATTTTTTGAGADAGANGYLDTNVSDGAVTDHSGIIDQTSDTSTADAAAAEAREEAARAEAARAAAAKEEAARAEAEREDAARADAANVVLDAALAEVYGFHPHTTTPPGSYAYAMFPSTGRTCRTLGGAMNGSPKDDEAADCHLNIGRRMSASAPARGLLPMTGCADGECDVMAIRASKADCGALGGEATDRKYGDGLFDCRMRVSSGGILSAAAAPRWGLYPVGECPAGQKCYPMRFSASNREQCLRIGGNYDGTGEWGGCDMLVGPASRATESFRAYRRAPRRRR